MRAQLLFEKRDFERGQVHLAACLKIRPRFAPALNAQGVVLSNLGRPVEAMRSFEAAVKSDPFSFYAHLNLGGIATVRRDANSARFHFERAAQACFDHADRHTRIAYLFGELRQLDRAESHFLEAIRLSPEWHKPFFGLGLGYYVRDDWMKSEMYFHQAIERNPHDLEYRRYLRMARQHLASAAFHMDQFRHLTFDTSTFDCVGSVVYDNYEVPVVAVDNFSQFESLKARLGNVSQGDSPLLFRGQTRSWLSNGKVSVAPSRFRARLSNDSLFKKSEKWRTGLRPFLGPLCDELKPGEVFADHKISINPPQNEQTGSMLSFTWQPELLGTMQHYGFPTEFLDVTRDPSIALWFALNSGTMDKRGRVCYSRKVWGKEEPTELWPVIYVFFPSQIQIIDLNDGCLSQKASLRAFRQKACLLSFTVFQHPYFEPFARRIGANKFPIEIRPRAPDLAMVLRLSPDASWKYAKLPTAKWLFPSADKVYRTLCKSRIPFVARYA